ncbi:hypothetical protein MNBD_ALPHA08-518, partial [hydrothermal vent metagenome]
DPYVFQICYKVPSPDLCKDLGWGGVRRLTLVAPLLADHVF